MNFHACAYIFLYVYFERNSVCIIRPAHPRSAEIDRVRGWEDLRVRWPVAFACLQLAAQLACCRGDSLACMRATR